MSAKAGRDITLTLNDGGKRKHWRAVVAGSTLTQTTWADGGKPKQTVRAFATAAAADAELVKIERRRYPDGYVRSVGFEDAGPGAAVFECYGPVLHDLSADGRYLAVARYGSAKDRWAKVEVVDMQTGERRAVLEEPAATPVGPYVHAALFDATGETLCVQLNTTTFRVDMRAGTREAIAGYEEFRTSIFNPHVVRPTHDAVRRRLVVFDADNIVRVLEGTRTIREVCTAPTTVECRGARISPSGRLLAVYRVSRGVMYDHADARQDATNQLQVWDIDSGKVVKSLAVQEPIDKVGFDVAERHLIVSHGNYGPAAYSLATGELVWRFDVPARAMNAVCYGWSYSPCGSLLAVGRWHEVSLYRGAGREPVAYSDPGAWKPERIVFSADGRVFAAEAGLNVLVRRTP